MKITSFNPIVATSHCEEVVKVFEELGFERKHFQENIDDKDMNAVDMKNEDGFRVDVGDIKGMQQDMTLIRMNVDDFDEAYRILTEHGFKNNRGDKTIDSNSSKSATMISPTGLTISLVKHIK
ncbi:MAG: hypothetical protein IJ696_05600 [Ruminococcus sp.]|nr:hypothetical protein [Ruminococcus sp.]